MMMVLTVHIGQMKHVRMIVWVFWDNGFGLASFMQNLKNGQSGDSEFGEFGLNWVWWMFGHAQNVIGIVFGNWFEVFGVWFWDLQVLCKLAKMA